MNESDEQKQLASFVRRILSTYAGHKAGKIDRMMALAQIERLAVDLGYTHIGSMEEPRTHHRQGSE